MLKCINLITDSIIGTDLLASPRFHRYLRILEKIGSALPKMTKNRFVQFLFLNIQATTERVTDSESVRNSENNKIENITFQKN